MSVNAAAVRRAAISQARDIASEAILAWKEYERTPDPARRSFVNTKVELLLAYLMATFCGEITLGEAQKITVEQGDKLSQAYLEQLRPAAVPLAVMRAVLKAHRIVFDVRRAPSWAIFAQRYGAYILAVESDALALLAHDQVGRRDHLPQS